SVITISAPQPIRAGTLCPGFSFDEESASFIRGSIESLAAYLRSYTSSIMAHDEGMAGICPCVAASKIHRDVAATAGARNRVGDSARSSGDAPAFAQDRDVQSSVGIPGLD